MREGAGEGDPGKRQPRDGMPGGRDDRDDAGGMVVAVQVGAARSMASDWVRRNVAAEPWFLGAYFAGSTTTLPDDADVPPTSDVDVFIVNADASPPVKRGKLIHGGLRIEVSPIAADRLASPEAVLEDYHLAEAFRRDGIICDPSGRLRPLQAEVARCFTQEAWVRLRCEHARGRCLEYLDSLDAKPAWHDQVTAWLFGTGITTHVLLVAGLRNPTVRLRYLRARDVLATYGRSEVYAELLELLGCVDLSAERVRSHAAALARTFDLAAAALRTPYAFASDISPVGRPLTIDGSMDLIRNGDHREAIFWIVATFARCRAVLAADAPQLGRELAPDFDGLLADLGITSSTDLIHRAAQVRRFLPRLWETAESILAAHPDIVRQAADGRS